MLRDHLSPPQNGLTPTLVTQLQPPMLPPPPYPSFKLVQPHTEVPPVNQPLLVTESAKRRLHERQTISISPQQQLHEVVEKNLADFVAPDTAALPESEKLVAQFLSEHSQSQDFDFLKSESNTTKKITIKNQSDDQPVSLSHLQYAQLYPQSLTKREFQQSASLSNQASQTKLGRSSPTVGWKTQSSDPEQSSSYFAEFDLELSTGPDDQINQTIKSLVDLASNQSGTQLSPIPPALLSTTAPHTTRPLNSKSQPPTASSSSIYAFSQTLDSSSKHQLIPDFHQVNISDQIHPNISKQTNLVNLTRLVNVTEVTELHKKNTSQSPMTSNDPRWEKQFEVLFLFAKRINYTCQ